ncbi:MAG: PQQ-binding-like beta-propeller repeat protein [Saprospiraceae bacterium]
MKYKILTSFVLVCYTFLSCYKPKIDPPKPKNCQEDTVLTALKPVWKVINWEDSSRQTMIEAVFYKNYFIHGTYNNYPESNLIMRDKATGQKIWESRDPALRDVSGTLDRVIYKDKLFIISSTGSATPEIKVIDLNNGNILYKEFISYVFPRISSFGNCIYYKIAYGNAPVFDSIQVWRFNMDNYQSEYILSLINTQYGPSIESMVEYVLNNGDSVIFFQNRQLSSKLKHRIDVLAYNLTQRKYIWRHDSVDYLGNSSVWPAIYKDGRVFFKAAAMLYCYNAETGAIIWQDDVGRRVGGDMILGNMLLEEGRVIVHSNGGSVCSFDELTGKHQWTALKWADTIGKMAYYKGKVYAASGANGNIHSLNIYNGNKIWNEISPNFNCYEYDANFGTCDLSIDPNTGHMIIGDYYYTMCIDLNK